MHRIYASACLKKSDNGALVVKDYTDMLLLSTSDILEENRLAQLKQISKVVPFTIATFIGSSGRTLKIIARVTLPDLPRRENEAEMEQFYRKAYKVAAAIYSSLLNVPVSPAGIKDGSSPVMANCLISADAAPLLMEKTTPLDVDGVELAPMSQTENIKPDDNNEVGALISFLSGKYEFRYNTVRGAKSIWTNKSRTGDGGLQTRALSMVCRSKPDSPVSKPDLRMSLFILTRRTYV